MHLIVKAAWPRSSLIPTSLALILSLHQTLTQQVQSHLKARDGCITSFRKNAETRIAGRLRSKNLKVVTAAHRHCIGRCRLLSQLVANLLTWSCSAPTELNILRMCTVPATCRKKTCFRMWIPVSKFRNLWHRQNLRWLSTRLNSLGIAKMTRVWCEYNYFLNSKVKSRSMKKSDVLKRVKTLLLDLG